MTHDCAEEICEMSDDNVEKEEGAVVGGQEGDDLNFNDSFNIHVLCNHKVKT